MSNFNATTALCLAMLSLSAVGTPARASAQEPSNLGQQGPRTSADFTPVELDGVGVREHLDAQLPLDATFRDHTGKLVRLGDFFRSGRPVLLNLAYFSCPVLCGMVQNGVVRGLRGIPWTAGREFDIVTLSIDPRDTPVNAARKRTQLLREYGRDEARSGWHFLVGDETQIARVTGAAGFRTRFDARQQQYAHPAVITLIKSNGRIGRYLYGLEFAPSDLRLSLLEVSEGRSLSSAEHFLLYCYRYDPQGSKYVIVANNIMKLGGALTAAGLFAFLGLMWRREVRAKRARNSTPGGAPPAATTSAASAATTSAAVAATTSAASAATPTVSSGTMPV